MRVSLTPREPPLTAAGVVARGPAVPALAAATARRIESGAALRAAAAEGWLLVLGAADDLPWADGCTFVGADGPLLVPTTRRAQPHPDLVAAALRGPAVGALVVLLEDAALVTPTPARPLDPQRLARPA
jgi:hypothetical protein